MLNLNLGPDPYAELGRIILEGQRMGKSMVEIEKENPRLFIQDGLDEIKAILGT